MAKVELEKIGEVFRAKPTPPPDNNGWVVVIVVIVVLSILVSSCS